MRCSRLTARVAAPTIPPTGAFSIPSISTFVDGAGLPRDGEFDAALAAEADAIGAAASLASVDYDAVWAIKRAALQARFSAFERARANRPGDPLTADHARFIDEGGEALRRFAIFQAIAEERKGEEWRRWPQALRDAEAGALEAKAGEHPEKVAFALFAQWLADRQLAGAAARAKAAGLEIGLYRDLAVGAAPDGAESWARAGELAPGVSVGAPPDPFSAQGQVWDFQPPDPVASCARRLARLRRAATRQHAPRRHVAHRSRDGAGAAVRRARRGLAGRRRLSFLSPRRSGRPCRAGEPAQRLHGGRRGPRHRARGLSR